MKTTLNLNDLVKIADEVDKTLYGIKSNESLFKHLLEETEELKDKMNSGFCVETPNRTTNSEDKFEQLKELGDVLFCIVSIARQNDLDLAHALSLTITKLQERIKFNIRE